MCDPVSLIGGALIGGVASQALAPRGGGGAAAPVADPEAERMKAEAEAATSANLRLAASQRRRREQASLIARGGSQPTLGEVAGTGDSTLNRTQALRTRLGPALAAASLLQRGATPAVNGGSRKGFTNPTQAY